MTTQATGPSVPSPSARIAVRSSWLVPFVGPDAPIVAREVVLRPRNKDAPTFTAVAGTGPGPLDDGAYAYARRHGLPFLRVDVGVIAGAVSGRKARPWSIIVHPECAPTTELAGAFAPIEALLVEDGAQTVLSDPSLLTRAAALRRTLVEQRISRFADAFVEPLLTESDPTEKSLVVVVVPSNANGSANTTALQTLLELAAREHPKVRIGLLLETAPFTKTVAKLPASFLLDARAFTLPPDVDRALLLERTAHVYTVDSTFGFEALLHHVPVTVFGQPFYAGFGLTRELGPPVTRPHPRSLDELVAAALIVAPKYRNPLRQGLATAEATVELLAIQRRHYLENRGRFVCVGFSWWKRIIVAQYLTSKGNDIGFVRDATGLARIETPPNTKIVVWASRPHEQSAAFAESRGLPLWRLEDGFIRSVGLGSDWSAPGSLVFDPEGIYYDPRTPSRLETLLSTVTFSDEELARAEALIALVVSLRVSKYNSQTDRDFAPKNRPGQRVVFVPGQVADDASVRFGGNQIGGVRQLLESVRRLAPEAHVLYKPHPDVLSGNRRGHVREGLGTWFDELVLDVPIARCLDCADEVHTISSLVGFEALLRNVPVTCHGQPFYAGWGLTRDRCPIPRRTRSLTLPMLVAGTLMRYPRYYHFASGNFCSAAQMAEVLATQQRSEPRPSVTPKLLRRLNSLLQLAKDLSHAG